MKGFPYVKYRTAIMPEFWSSFLIKEALSLHTAGIKNPTSPFHKALCIRCKVQTIHIRNLNGYGNFMYPTSNVLHISVHIRMIEGFCVTLNSALATWTNHFNVGM